jgi:preprotein translocase subunit SecA
MATAGFLEMQNRVDDVIAADMSAWIVGKESAESALERLKGPFSTWTYLVNEDQFGWGIENFREKDIGFAFTGPLYMSALIINRLFRNRKR